MIIRAIDIMVFAVFVLIWLNIGSLEVKAQEPEVQWEMATWSPVDQDGDPQTQDDSGEDWAYDVELSEAGSSPDGYIYAGYTTFPDYQFTSGGFECPSQYLDQGCAIPKLFKTDLDGNLLWYDTYTENEGQLTAVVQTSDGGYLAVGRSRERGSRLTYYGEADSTTSLDCTNVCSRNIFAVKTYADGSVEWEKLYGVADNPNNSLLIRDSEAWDVVEMPDGNFRIVGQVLDPNDPERDDLGGYISKAFILEVNSSGVRQWIAVYGNSEEASIARGLARDGNDYAMVLNQFDQPEYLDADADADIWVYKVGSGSSPSPIFKSNLTNSSSEHDFGFDVVYNTSGDILISGVIDCFNPLGGCFRSNGARGEGTARVYRVDASNGDLLDDTASELGTVKAFDLWATLAPTSDGGSVFVSTKQPVSQDPSVFTETDAFVAKVNSSVSGIQWDFTYDAETTKSHLNREGTDVGFTNQECLYAIVPAPAGGYVISGNNSSNFDDDYVVHFEDASSQTVDNTIVDHEHIYYWGPDNLTVGPSVTIEPTAYVEFVARNSIIIEGPFEAKLGSTFEAEIDPSFSGIETQSMSASEPVIARDLDAPDHANNATHEEAATFELQPNHPNPFNPSTKIRFSVPEETPVTLIIYDVVGREVARLLDGTVEGGVHGVRWDASLLPSGVYIYRLEAGTFTKTRRMTLVK